MFLIIGKRLYEDVNNNINNNIIDILIIGIYENPIYDWEYKKGDSL